MSETNNSNEVVVSIKNLQKAFGDNVVLRDIDLDVHKGEVVVVLGPSGSGKSTMLRCINRLEHPTSGSIVVEGVDVCAKGVDLNKVRTHLGMVFQQFNLFPHLSVKKNVMLAQQKVLKRSKEEAEKIAIEELTKVGLAERIDLKSLLPLVILRRRGDNHFGHVGHHERHFVTHRIFQPFAVAERPAVERILRPKLNGHRYGRHKQIKKSSHNIFPTVQFSVTGSAITRLRVLRPKNNG